MGLRIGAVCFDAGGTLLRMEPPAEVIFAEICREQGVAVTPDEVGLAYERSEPWFTEHRELYLASPEAFWLQGNRVLLNALGVRQALDPLAAVIAAEFPRRHGAWTPYPEVPEILAALRRRGLPLAVVSNWDPGLAHLLERLGLRDAFAVIVTSAETGVAKPDPEIFLRAVTVLGVEPTEALHVGDLYGYDVIGARAAGLIPVLLDRHPRPGGGGPARGDGDRDVVRITDLWGLLPIIDGGLAAAEAPR